MIKVTKKIGDVNESIECETVGELLEYERARDIPITEIAEVFERVDRNLIAHIIALDEIKKIIRQK